MNPQMIAASLVPFLIWLAVVVYLFLLLRRLVSGVERIASALERRPADSESRP